MIDMAFRIGQTVRMCAELREGWTADRLALGGSGAELAGTVGRVVGQFVDDGYCGLCEYYEMDCPGPWYGVEFAAFGTGLYGEHELEHA